MRRKRRPLAYLPGKNCPPIETRAEEYALLVEYHNGSLAARNRLIEGNLRYVTVVAIRQRGRLDEEDAIQEAAMAMLLSVEKCDKGRSFGRYVATIIRNRLADLRLKTIYQVVIPTTTGNAISRLRRELATGISEDDWWRKKRVPRAAAEDALRIVSAGREPAELLDTIVQARHDGHCSGE